MRRKLVASLAITAIGISILSIILLPSNLSTSRSASLNNPLMASPYIVEYKLPSNGSGPMAIAVDRGVVWVVAGDRSLLVKLDLSTRVFTEYKIPSASPSNVWTILIGQDGKLWFPSEVDNAVWAFDPIQESFSKYDMLTPKSAPFRLAMDKDGKVWVTLRFSGKLAVINPSSGKILEHTIPTNSSDPGDISIALNGDVWFTELFANKIGRFSEERGFAEYSPSEPIYSPTGLVIDGNGSIWFTQHAGIFISNYNPRSGSLLSYPTSVAVKYPISLPEWIISDKSGRLWFNEHAADRIAMFDPMNEVMVEYEIPNPSSTFVYPLHLAISSDGNVWFTEYGTNKIGMVDVSKSVPFTLDVSPRKISATPGSEVRIRVSVSGVSDKPIRLQASSTFALTGKFRNATAQFSPEQIPALKNDAHASNLIIRLGKSLAPGDYVVSVGASDGAVVYSVMVHIEVMSKG